MTEAETMTEIIEGQSQIGIAPLQVKIKKLHKDAVIPTYAKPGDAGMDLTAVSRRLVTDETGNLPDYIEYGTGLAIEIPIGYVGLVLPRSSNSKQDLYLANHVGCIDSSYRGEITLRYKMDSMYESVIDQHDVFFVIEDDGTTFKANVYGVGDRVGQLIIIPYPQVKFKEVTELSTTERGSGGYGHTGK